MLIESLQTLLGAAADGFTQGIKLTALDQVADMRGAEHQLYRHARFNQTARFAAAFMAGEVRRD